MIAVKRTITSLISAGAGSVLIAMAMIKPLEGIEYQPYRDVVGVLTVCYGHTGADIIEGKTYTQKECEQLLEQDLAKVKAQIDPLIILSISEHTRAALYSFTYNVGVGAFTRSTLLKKLNSGDVALACNELKRWVYAGGQKWKGLITRREIEEDVCSLQLS